MTKRGKRSEGRQSQWWVGLLVVLALLVADFLGFIDLGDLTWEEDPPPQQPGQRVPTTVTSDWYELAFTSPGADTTWPTERLVETIDAAEERVWIAVFDFELEPVMEAMAEAHERGVDVRLVLDADNEGLPEVQELVRRRVPVQSDTRTALMHSKFVVIDDDETWMGSMNLTLNDVTRHNNNFSLFRSRELNENFAMEFEEMWDERFGPTSPADTPYPRLDFDGDIVDIYFSPEDEPRLAVLDTINSAEESIHFMAFTFTDEAIAEAMIQAERRGVEVAGVFETFQASAGYSQYPRMENLGMAVRLDGNGGIMHHKVIIVDGETVVTGSYNFTAAASNSNDEAMLIIQNTDIASAFEEEWARIWEEAKR